MHTVHDADVEGREDLVNQRWPEERLWPLWQLEWKVIT